MVLCLLTCRYDKVEVNSMSKDELSFLAYRKVPVLVFEDVTSAQYNRAWSAFPDSSVIITALYNYLLSAKMVSDADGPIPDVRVHDTEQTREELHKLSSYAVHYGLGARKEAAPLQRDADEADLEARWRS